MLPALTLLTALLAAEPGKVAPLDPNMGIYEGTWSLNDENKGTMQAKVWARGQGKYEGNLIVVHGDDGLIEAPFTGELRGAKVDFAGVRKNTPDDGGKVEYSGVIGDGRLVGSFKVGDATGSFNLEKKTVVPPTLGAKPPAGAIVLFDGKNLDQWTQRNGQPPAWKLIDGDAMEVSDGDITTKQKWGDLKLHLEFKTPFMPESWDQQRGNSGVYVHGRYEVQVLDSFGLPPKDNQAGGIYKQAVPKVNASLPPGDWQTYDITFRAAKVDAAGKQTESAVITVEHNGIIIHDRVRLTEPTPGGIDKVAQTTGGLFLQNHRNPVQFRNIWLLPL